MGPIMDCHVFRRLCQELVPLVLGARVEKIHQPAPDLTMFALYAASRKRYLFLRADRKDPFLFCAAERMPVGTEPPAFIMRLRKYFSGQRLVDVQVQWLLRRIFLRARGEDEAGAWLELDLREGPKLHIGAEALALSAVFAADTEGQVVTGMEGELDSVAERKLEAEVAWPSPEDVNAFCARPQDYDWRRWPVLSPALRRTLPLLDAGERAALLGDLQDGGGDLFLYGEGADIELSAWPLPEPLRANRPETVCESALEAVARAGGNVLCQTGERAGKSAAKPHVNEADRLRRLLLKLEDERGRLGRMVDAKADALALQAELYRFAADEKQDSVQLESGRDVRLDPRLTVRENMAAMFHRAGRGARGLEHLVVRLERVERERHEALNRAAQSALASAGGAPVRPLSREKASKTPVLPKNVLAFQSSDGFLLLRGRDAKGNLALLKLAAPHDLWLHVGNGVAGAHVIIRRHHAGQELPERTLQEAGSLAALKSERRGDARVEIVAALVKYVRPMKQAGRVGTVRMDRVESTWTVSPEPGLEEQLSAGSR